MTAKVAALRLNYSEYLSGYCLFEKFCPSDPLWYTKIERLKAAGDDRILIQKCLHATTIALTRNFDFGGVNL